MQGIIQHIRVRQNDDVCIDGAGGHVRRGFFRGGTSQFGIDGVIRKIRTRGAIREGAYQCAGEAHSKRRSANIARLIHRDGVAGREIHRGPLRVDIATPVSGPESDSKLLLYIGIGQAF